MKKFSMILSDLWPFSNKNVEVAKQVSDTKVTNITNITDSERLDKLEEKLLLLEAKLSKNISIIKELTNTVLEVHETSLDIVKTEPKETIQRDNKTEIERRITELDKKYDAVLDILADKFSDNEKLPNLFVGDVSLKDLWRKYSNKKDVLLYSIAYMLKKQLEEKGAKVK